MEQFVINKVVSKDIINDFVSKFQNMVGANLTPYERMVNKGVKQIQDELEKNNIKLSWYRYQITQLTNGAIAIMLYGDKK
jgi:uncharacterized protein YbjQ (UPF0145 family)